MVYTHAARTTSIFSLEKSQSKFQNYISRNHGYAFWKENGSENSIASVSQELPVYITPLH